MRGKITILSCFFLFISFLSFGQNEDIPEHAHNIATKIFEENGLIYDPEVINKIGRRFYTFCVFQETALAFGGSYKHVYLIYCNEHPLRKAFKLLFDVDTLIKEGEEESKYITETFEKYKKTRFNYEYVVSPGSPIISIFVTFED
ncbi:MAG: hypothetical protein QXL18_05505 [Candidatus Woesearchaeota archaeon]